MEIQAKVTPQPSNDANASSQGIDEAKKRSPRKPNVKRPNYNQIHAKPLPLEIHPLPAFIPHNPLSIVRIAISLLSRTLWRPKSCVVTHRAYFSPETQSIHVTDPQSIRALWEQGFWGGGSLSRSEPRWLDQEKRKRGLEAAATSEEFTRGRREERRQFKLERAKAQREAIEQQLREEGKLAPKTISEIPSNGDDDRTVVDEPSVSMATDASVTEALQRVPTDDPALAPEQASPSSLTDVPIVENDIKDQEHLQLTFEEAFFLVYVLGVLDIYENDRCLSTTDLLRRFCAHSEYTPLLSPDATFSRLDTPVIKPDDPFLMKYVVFHHFRSLGWVVRPGIKFACDYLLYLRGPAFHHAEFAIMIVPAYSDSYWSANPERRAASDTKTTRDWWWLHRLNRVQTQVHKTLMLVYVEVPSPWEGECTESSGALDIGSALIKYKVREFIWKRWSPNRNRD